MKTHTIKVKVNLDIENISNSNQDAHTVLKDISYSKSNTDEGNIRKFDFIDTENTQPAGRDNFSSIGHSSFLSAKCSKINSSEMQKIKKG